MEIIIRKLRANNFGFVEIISRMINWGCLPIVALFAEPETFGQIVLVYSSIIIVTTLGGFGQQRAILMYAHCDHTAFFYANILSITAAIIIGFSTVLFFHLSPIITLIVLLNVQINNLVSNARSTNDFFTFSVLRVGITLSRFVFVMVFLSIKLSITVYLYAEFFSALLVIVIWFFVKPLPLNRASFKTDFNKIFSLFSFGLPLFLQSGVAQITQLGDRFIVSSSLGEAVLASYFFVSVFCSSVAFIFSFNAQKYEVRIYRATDIIEAKKNTTEFCVTSLKLTVIFYFISLSLYFLITYFGGKYEFDFLLMTSLFVNSSLFVFSIAMNYYFSYLGKNKYIILLSSGTAILFIAIVYFLISKLGLYSIAIAGFIVSLIYFLLFLFSVIKLKGLFDT